MKQKTVILANGKFPTHGIPLGYLYNADRIVCCDGAIANLEDTKLSPWAIVGDLDSVPPDLKEKYSAVMFPDPDQETNDLTKAMAFCVERGITDVVILGATGLREDHTVGNISLLADYAEVAQVKMVTDNGILIPILSPASLSTWPEQQVSIFSLDPAAIITVTGLEYPVDGINLGNWWRGTLNRAVSESIEVSSSSGGVIVYLGF